ncbi:uncharacterized protein C8R40DRAFT_1017286, partial [Lentinula edodes]|uniref:uncharacterized protein n=1 Tax=Lentinula edodes TaxID=5353 RepID=UPI001E8D2031
SKAFYSWLAEVIEFGCYYRRNQRPTHPGIMAQVGLTMGARHIPASMRKVGYGTSYYRKLSDESKQLHDEDAIAASGIFWSMALSTMPAEVTAPMVEILSNCNIPHMATQYVAPGKGFHLQIGERHMIYPNVNRAPPELYMISGYSA